ncbi:hypothetical protein EVAR_49504_1 [Eumeta japonica]|uniref:Uncharacterized protein n=1 Tax=Eumeta variegata TaxID=151549 RepID=A0A4C1VUY4_EUMVA|nr:hypothetical protein EVAR_49504_1 [Eumeta japonica]
MAVAQKRTGVRYLTLLEYRCKVAVSADSFRPASEVTSLMVALSLGGGEHLLSDGSLSRLPFDYAIKNSISHAMPAKP